MAIFEYEDSVLVVSGPYTGRRGFVSYEWRGNRYSVRFGSPEAWQGEAILSGAELKKC